MDQNTHSGEKTYFSHREQHGEAEQQGLAGGCPVSIISPRPHHPSGQGVPWEQWLLRDLGAFLSALATAGVLTHLGPSRQANDTDVASRWSKLLAHKAVA